MDRLTFEKFTEVTDRIIIVCKRQKISVEDFFAFFEYFNFLKESQISPIDAVYVAEALINSRIHYLNDAIDTVPGKIKKQTIAETKELLKDYYTKKTDKEVPSR